jgi:hypothetical protein
MELPILTKQVILIKVKFKALLRNYWYVLVAIQNQFQDKFLILDTYHPDTIQVSKNVTNHVFFKPNGVCKHKSLGNTALHDQKLLVSSRYSNGGSSYCKPIMW